MREAARKQIPATPRVEFGEPVLDRCSGLLSDLELHWSACFLLNDCDAVPNAAASANFVDLSPRQITTVQLAIDGEIEQSEVVVCGAPAEAETELPSFGFSGRFCPIRRPLFQGNIRPAAMTGFQGPWSPPLSRPQPLRSTCRLVGREIEPNGGSRHLSDVRSGSSLLRARPVTDLRRDHGVTTGGDTSHITILSDPRIPDKLLHSGQQTPETIVGAGV